MKISIDLDCSVEKNASKYYELNKKLRRKIEGLKKATLETRNKLGKGKQEKTKKKRKKPKPYERYYWTISQCKELIISGKNAAHNDEIYAKYLKKDDLFFHADIVGASATVLKGNKGKQEAAEMAACFSRAWKLGYSEVDVYALKPENVKKHSPKGHIGKGAFYLEGEREWFRNTQLILRIGIDENGQVVIRTPSNLQSLEKQVIISPGSLSKEEAAKEISRILGIKVAEIHPLLPSGGISIRM